MKPVLLYSHVDEPITSTILASSLVSEFDIIKISLKSLLDDISILDELVDNEIKIRWTLSSGFQVINSNSFYLINRVLSVPEELFNEFAESDRAYALSEFRAYLAFSIQAFPNSTSKPGAFGLSGNRFSLPRQWEMIKMSNFQLATPDYFLGNLELINRTSSLVYSNPHDYYYWKPNGNHINISSQSFAFKRPVGIPLICFVTEYNCELFSYFNIEKISTDQILMIKEQGRNVSRFFDYDIAEVLFFYEDSKISFGMISCIPYASKRRQEFLPFIECFFRNKFIDYEN